MNGKEIIEKLQLIPHPEGGFYRQTYRADQQIELHPNRSRHVNTAIYFLLLDDGKSMFHRIQSDELWFFHQGEPLEIIWIEKGELKARLLGNNLSAGEQPQISIPAKTWFAARMKNPGNYSLVSCTVAPGFDFEDFELADPEGLSREFPKLKETIQLFTRG